MHEGQRRMGEGLAGVVVAAVFIFVVVFFLEVYRMVLGRERRIRRPKVRMKREAGSCSVVLGPSTADTSSCKHFLACSHRSKCINLGGINIS